MKIHTHLFTLLVILFITYHHSGGQQLNCPKNQIHYEKLIGIKPSTYEKSTLLYKSNNATPATLNCLTRCESATNCSSFLLYYNTSECYSYANINNITTVYDYDSKPDTNVIWFRKTCLNVPNNCKTKAWAIEIQAGATLIGYNTRKIDGYVSRQQCIDNCIAEKRFVCKSMKFNVRSNLVGVMEANPIGTCTLSETDRHLTTSAFRVSRYEDEYIGNECVNTSYSSDYCAYEQYDNVTLGHTDLTFTNYTQEECRNMCDMSFMFNCRGYSIIPVSRRQSQLTQTYNCLLHSEDSKLIGPKLLVEYRGATYFERARCLDVSVTCSPSTMSIIYKPEQAFSGRIYTNGYSDTRPCYADAHNNDTIILTIPMNGSICGLSQANSIGDYNRTLQSVLLVIQYNALIQTQADRLIKVGCYDGAANSNNDGEVTVGASVNFTNNYPNHGSTLVNSSSVTPRVTMRILDYNTNQPVSNTELGDDLQMVIEITPGDGPYDIWAGNLIATSDNPNDTIVLLDENGCSAYYNLVLPFTSVKTNSSKMLVTKFQAFKFPSTPVLRFSVMVHFCTLTCPPRNCSTDNTRTKREVSITPQNQSTIDTTNALVYKILSRKNENDNDSDIGEQMPLEIELIVKGINLSPDQAVLGENRLLIAGYDVEHKEVCMDYSLFIALLVLWVLLQVIIVVCCCLLIRKYKKYFHVTYTRQLDDMYQQSYAWNLGRRVRWADQ